ncbi:hypothetical protein NM208_g4013 [Fusarium decemcellulare]|uniref:Uncharacterized protein n=1 Tax=Fusarium decemcellulare TaxID=57161 RepID=A0ACC1SM34_9HYPO|nr:hypothetical protein NM208_g4013 [Fusarium decemcellulare]
MLRPSLFLVLATINAVASSAPALVEERASCVQTCSSTCYWQSDIDAALNKGYSLFQSGDTLGSGDYPHQYNDREGFTFTTPGPWYEFPILSTFKVYSGGSPGPDRVIFDSGGNFDSLITHTGASGDNFVTCK